MTEPTGDSCPDSISDIFDTLNEQETALNAAHAFLEASSYADLLERDGVILPDRLDLTLVEAAMAAVKVASGCNAELYEICFKQRRDAA